MKPPSLISPSVLAIYSLGNLTNLSFAILQLCVSAVPVAFPLQATVRDSPSRTLAGIAKLMASAFPGSERPRRARSGPVLGGTAHPSCTEQAIQAHGGMGCNLLLSRDAKVLFPGPLGGSVY